MAAWLSVLLRIRGPGGGAVCCWKISTNHLRGWPKPNGNSRLLSTLPPPPPRDRGGSSKLGPVTWKSLAITVATGRSLVGGDEICEERERREDREGEDQIFGEAIAGRTFLVNRSRRFTKDRPAFPGSVGPPVLRLHPLPRRLSRRRSRR
ncbi:unnamed protein product [Staurois parvus]|uniref:Secreted protein n=1 Tax=Staurois parvus TaxID=386267 RepID=A0ABN9FY14_9NEOB|nr:unnamed protein product [Staurois parvus]